MFGSPAGKSVDNLRALSPGARPEFNLHSSRRPASRRSSTASSVRSVGGTLDNSSWGDAVYESGQNGRKDGRPESCLC